MTADDLDWATGILAERRESLVPRAAIFWRASEHAARFHRAFLAKLLTQGGARGYRTGTAVLIAAPRGPGWNVDDFWVPQERWASPDAQAVWDAFARTALAIRCGSCARAMSYRAAPSPAGSA